MKKSNPFLICSPPGPGVVYGNLPCEVHKLTGRKDEKSPNSCGKGELWDERRKPLSWCDGGRPTRLLCKSRDASAATTAALSAKAPATKTAANAPANDGGLRKVNTDAFKGATKSKGSTRTTVTAATAPDVAPMVSQGSKVLGFGAGVIGSSSSAVDDILGQLSSADQARGRSDSDDGLNNSIVGCETSRASGKTHVRPSGDTGTFDNFFHF